MNNWRPLDFLSKNWIIATGVTGFVFIHLGCSIYYGLSTNHWIVLISNVLALSLLTVLFSIFIRLVSRFGHQIQDFAFLVYCLLIFSSCSLPWQGLVPIYLIAGFVFTLLVAFLYVKSILAGLVAFSLYILNLVLSQRIGLGFAVDVREVNELRFLLAGSIWIPVLPLLAQGVQNFQSRSIRNKLMLASTSLVLFTFIAVTLLSSDYGLKLKLGSQAWWMAALFVFFVVLLTGYLWIRKIFRLFDDFAAVIEKVDRGDYNLNLRLYEEEEVSRISRALNILSDRLRSLAINLELMVTERTYMLERKIDQLRKAADVSLELTALRNLDELVERSVNQIAEKFGFDHVLLYLFDDRNENLVLVSAAGYRVDDLITKGVRIQVGEPDPVWMVTSSGRPRIFKNLSSQTFTPYLPDTQSRMIFPLRSSSGILGVIDFHSDQPDYFDDETLQNMAIVVDQLALSIDTAKMVRQMNINLQELKMLTGRFTYQSWKSSQKVIGIKEGYVYQGALIKKRDTQPLDPKKSQRKASPSVISIPLNLRDQTIGRVDFKFENDKPDPDIVEALQEMTQRLVLMMENARLIMEARNLAAREQQINQITSQVRSSVNVESILRNTVQELGKAFGATRAFIQIGLTPGDKEEDNNTDPQERGQ